MPKGIHKGSAPEFVFCRGARHITEMPTIFSQFWRFLALSAALAALAGCSRMSTLSFDTKLAVGSVSLVDRCTDFMHRAYPETTIDVAGSHVATGAEAATITVDGVRSDVPVGTPYARNIAAECRFEGGILTGFRWTEGPIRSATTGQVP